MGIRGLESFIEGTQASKRVKIETLLQDYREQHGHVSKTTIVVDGTGCLRHLYSKLDWVCGGQMKEFKEITGHFVQCFKNLNIDLVFFFDGPTVEEKRRVWIKRRVEGMNKVNKVFNLLKNPSIHSHQQLSNGWLFILPPGIGNVARFLFNHEFHCEVHVSVKESDEEIAEYARRNNCFAILAQDTDFVILEGGKYYLSMKNLCLDTMETTLYDRQEFAKSINLDLQFFPFLGTLLGNDIVDKVKLQRLYNKIKVSSMCPVREVATFLNSFPLKESEKVFDNISEFIVGDTSLSDLIRTSVDSYKTLRGPDDETLVNENCFNSNAWKEIVREALIRHRNGFTSAHVWAVIIGQPFELSTALENFNKKDLHFAGNLYLPLRRKIYGILLKEKPKPEGKKEHQIHEWVVVPGFEKTKSYVTTEPIYPKVEHPGLIKLWSDKSDEVADLRWNLFVRTISDTMDGDALRRLDNHFIIPTAAIRYMYDRFAIDKEEARAFIATAVVVYNSTADWLKNIHLRFVDEKAVRLATLYTRAFGMLTMLVTGIGEPIPIKSVMPWLCFDGKLFQKIYRNAVEGESNFNICKRRESYLDSFFQIGDVVFKNKPS